MLLPFLRILLQEIPLPDLPLPHLKVYSRFRVCLDYQFFLLETKRLFLFFLPFLRITQFASLPFLAYLYALYHRSLHLLTGNSNHFIKNLIIITGISISFVQHFTKISPRTLLQIYAPDKKPKTIKKRRIPSLLL